MKRLFCALVLLVVILGFSGCNSQTLDTTPPSQEKTIENKDYQSMKLVINEKTFDVVLENNATTKELIKLLPMTITMNELNGNEKYCYLDTSLPMNPQRVNRINTGDIMLFGNNCLVVFYKSFSTNYSYTKIGNITNTTDLVNVVGDSYVKVEWNAS